MAKIKLAKTGITKTDELIAFVTTVVNTTTGKISYIAKTIDGTEYDIAQKKLSYAYANKGVVRGRPYVVENAAGEITYKWRVVKERFINRIDSTVEATVKPKTSKTISQLVA